MELKGSVDVIYMSMGSDALDDTRITHLYEYITSFPEGLILREFLKSFGRLVKGEQFSQSVAPMCTHSSKESVPQF